MWYPPSSLMWTFVGDRPSRIIEATVSRDIIWISSDANPESSRISELRDVTRNPPFAWLILVLLTTASSTGSSSSSTESTVHQDLLTWSMSITVQPFGGRPVGRIVLAMMTWLAAREKQHQRVSVAALRWQPWMILGFVLLFVQIALGGWVSTNYAALACMDFPTCGGQWVPHMDLQNGFSLIRGLGELPTGEMISQEALVGIHWIHRNFAWIVFIYMGTLAWQMRAEPGLRTPATWVLALLCAQLFTGLTTIFFEWPLLIAVLHNGGAAGLVLMSTTLLVRIASARPTTIRV